LAAFDESEEFQVLNHVDLTTLAVAPKRRHRESREELNSLAARVRELSKTDRSSQAYLVNFDKELCGIKVLNRWKTEKEWDDGGRKGWGVGETGEDGQLVDIQCLRIVATNPAVTEDDADALVEYLTRLLEQAWKEGSRLGGASG
jgi:hypothetical protein